MSDPKQPPREEVPEGVQQISRLVGQILAVSDVVAAPPDLALSALLSAYLTRARDAGQADQAAAHMIKAGLQWLKLVAARDDAELPQNQRSSYRLAYGLLAGLADEPHAHTLGALLHAYQTTALQYTCCTEQAAANASTLADRLAQAAALHGATPASGVH